MRFHDGFPNNVLAVNYNIVSVFLFRREPWSCASQKRESLTLVFVGQVSPTAFSLIESYSRVPAKHPFGGAISTLMNSQAYFSIDSLTAPPAGIFTERWILAVSYCAYMSPPRGQLPERCRLIFYKLFHPIY